MDITEEEVAKTMSISQTHLSLDAPLTPGEDNKLLDYLARQRSTRRRTSRRSRRRSPESIEEALAHLKERESKILRLYFGLDGEEPMTLEEIGSLLGITRERVRQIKEKALSRLRHVVARARAGELPRLSCRRRTRSHRWAGPTDPPIVHPAAERLASDAWHRPHHATLESTARGRTRRIRARQCRGRGSSAC